MSARTVTSERTVPSERTVSLVFVTAPNRESASQIAEALIEKRLAACVARLPEVESTYRWEGKVERSTEVQLLIKTASDQLPELERCVLALHPYKTPEIVAFPAHFVNDRYLQWVLAETSV